MAGRARYKAFVQKLGAAATAAGYDDPIDYVNERIGNGEPLWKIAAEVGQMTRWTLWRWIEADPDRLASYERARTVSAGALVEEAQHILDTANEASPAAVMSARNRAHFRQWQAAMHDKRLFAKSARATVQVNIGALHLDTLRKLGSPAALPPDLGNGHVLPPAEVEVDPDDA